MIFIMTPSTHVHADPVFVWDEALGKRAILTASGGDKAGQDKAGSKTKDNVITPGGPRRPEEVHPVGPGKMVRRNPDGTYSVVPDTAPGGSQEPP